MVYARHMPNESTRIGIITGRRVGNAVKRNRLKRICRELVRGASARLSPGYECILYPKTRILETSSNKVTSVWNEMLKEIELL